MPPQQKKIVGDTLPPAQNSLCVGYPHSKKFCIGGTPQQKVLCGGYPPSKVNLSAGYPPCKKSCVFVTVLADVSVLTMGLWITVLLYLIPLFPDRSMARALDRAAAPAEGRRGQGGPLPVAPPPLFAAPRRCHAARSTAAPPPPEPRQAGSQRERGPSARERRARGPRGVRHGRAGGGGRHGARCPRVG